MKRTHFMASILLAGLGFATSANAFNWQLEGQVKAKADNQVKVFTTDGKPMELPVDVKAQTFQTQGTTDGSATHFISLAWVCSPKGDGTMVQMYTPVAFTAKGVKEKVVIKVGDGANDALFKNADNKQLYAYTKFLQSHLPKVATEGVEHPAAYLQRIVQVSDSLSGKVKDADVRHYLNVWSYTVQNSNAHILQGMFQRNGKALPMEVSQAIGEPQKVLDTPLALNFPTATSIIVQAIPLQLPLAEQVERVRSQYKTQSVVNAAVSEVITRFVAQYNYDRGNYEADRAQLETLLEGNEKKDVLLRRFDRQRSTASGSQAPTCAFTGADGADHTFAEFKGKYVYVDLWATWCVPCRKELPYLHELEKDLNRNDVVFLSISLDQKEDVWKNFLESKNMSGNQWIIKDDKFEKALNIKGIPHFLLYGKDGKLLQYNAPRPSMKEKVNAMFDSLK